MSAGQQPQGANLPGDLFVNLRLASRFDLIFGIFPNAFENFCMQFYEYDVAVVQLDKSRLEVIGKEMHLENSLWTDIEIEN
ncbi:MAG: hypothetical protein GY737_09195 [Desulfobacteraceae bacterium]|nr:hypothetical protein [Desulfobacteraceae bacterium]